MRAGRIKKNFLAWMEGMKGIKQDKNKVSLICFGRTESARWVFTSSLIALMLNLMKYRIF